MAVMMGGWSSERTISLQSGQAIFDALQRKKVDAYIIDPQQDVIKLQTEKFDRAFIALHGHGGEDGVIQGMLEMLKISYTGSNILGSSLAMDKCFSKYIWKSQALPTPAFVKLNEKSDWHSVTEHLGLPLIVKPARSGSSYGISKVHDVKEIRKAWQHACQYDELVMAESWIEGDEYTVAILNDEALPIIRLETPREFYDYEAKYMSNTTQYHCPSGLDAETEYTLGHLALDAFRLLGASGWGRVDLLIDHNNSPWLIEVNTVPGMTDHSLVPMAAKHKGISFDDLIIQILSTSL